MTARKLNEADYARIKAATKRLIKSHGSAEAAALDTRVSEGHLLKCHNGNPEFAANFLAADCVADLERGAPEPYVTKALAALAGFVLIPAPPAHLVDTAHSALFLKLVQEAGVVMTGIGKALEDGQIEKREIRDLALLTETRKLFELSAEMVALLERIMAGD